jgi:hypothetical protein
MSARAQASGDGKVVQLKPRKAKGAKSSGGRKPASRMKAAAPAPKAPAAPAQPSDAEIRQQTQDRLVALRANLLPVERKMAAAQETVGALREQTKQIRASIQTIIPLAIYDEADKKLKLKTKRSDQELYEKQRALAFEAFGLAAGPQAELELQGVPEAAKPGLHWRSVGYQAAIDGLFSDPQRDGVPPDGDSIQEYQAGFADGTAANARGIKLLKADAKKKPDLPPASIPGGEAKAAVKVAGVDPGVPEGDATALVEVAAGGARVLQPGEQPDWSGFDNDPNKWSPEQHDIFAAWFDSLPEDADIDILHEGVATAFDRAVEAEPSDIPPEDGEFD